MKWQYQYITPSRVDNFAQFQTGKLYNFGDAPEYTEEKFIDDLLRINQDTTKMDAGIAVHSYLEHAQYGQELSGLIKIGDWIVEIDDTLDIEYQAPTLRERWIEGQLAGVRIIGRLDGREGDLITDIKTTSKAISEVIDKYLSSYQWKMYCMITEVYKFRYDIFKVKIDEFEDSKMNHIKKVKIVDYSYFHCYFNDDMKLDVISIINEYKEYLDSIADKIIERAKYFNVTIDFKKVR